MELELINGARFGNWVEHCALEAQETALLEQLHGDLCLRERLVPVTESQLMPGLVLIYHLGKNTFGCHCLRSRESGYKYLPDTDVRGGTRAGLFFTLADTV